MPTKAMPTKAKKSKDAAAAERKLWRKERRQLVTRRKAILAESSRELTRLQRALDRLHRSTAERIAACDHRDQVLAQRIGA